MKATVYAVVDAVVHAAVEANAGPSRSSRWKWRISLDFGTDLRYWQTGSARQAGQAGWAGQVGLAGQAGLAGTAGRVGRSGPVRTIYKLEPPLPLGVALDLARALDQRGCLPSGGKNPESETKSNSWLEAFCETVLRLLRHCCELRGIEPPAADSVRLAKAAAEQLSAAVVPEERGASGRAAEMMRFAQFLQGRAVIPEEIAGFLRRQGVERADEVWPSFVQFAYLRGWATIGCGLRPEFVRSKWSLVRRLVYTCERCGNTERMRRSLCATCGQMCMYCEACLNMGRVRECTPLVVGPAPPMPAISSELPGKLLGGLSGEPEDLTAGGIGTKKGMEKESMPGVTVPSAALVISLVPDRPEAPVPSCPVSCRVPDLSRWGLSEAQREAVRQAFRFLRRCREGREPPPREFLIWAVTTTGNEYINSGQLKMPLNCDRFSVDDD
jgi:hypothetical protein